MTIDDIITRAAEIRSNHLVQEAAYAELQAKYRAAAAMSDLDKAKVDFRTSELLQHRFKNENRPSVFLGAGVHRVETDEGVSYRAFYYEVEAYGSTPEIAFENFDRVWTQGEPK